MRSPLWVLPTIGDGQRVYSAEEIQHFRKTPEALLRVRKLNEAVVNSIFCKKRLDTFFVQYPLT